MHGMGGDTYRAVTEMSKKLKKNNLLLCKVVLMF